MHTFADMAKALNRSTVYPSGLQKRFELQILEGSAYTPAYLAFLRGLIALRTFEISEETLRDLWHLEKKLLRLLHLDSTGSPTWFLNACGQTSHPERRLLLTNFDLGVTVPSREFQLGLNFATMPPELFAGTSMGEAALRVLNAYVAEHARIHAALAAEFPHVRADTKWVTLLARAAR